MKATEEQKTKAKERREHTRQLSKQIAAMTPEQQAELSSRTLICNTEGKPYSLHNQFLIMLQGGTSSTMVGGFHQWLKLGRCVRKGQHGYAIWFPTKGKEATDAICEEGKDTFFLLGTVFDVSQTEEIEKKIAA
jgi:antirestriction protein ArdC